MKKVSILSLFFFNAIILNGQNIEIGQDVNEVKDYLEWTTSRHNMVHHDSLNNSNWSWDIVYENDKKIELVQCFNNEYIYGLGNINYYCKHYIFNEGHLAYTSTVFTDIDSATINKYLRDNFGYYKIGRYYFSEDYNYYSDVKVWPSWFVEVNWRRAEWNDLSPEIQDTINNRLTKERDMGIIPPEVEKPRLQREIKSRTYDLQVHDSTAYNLFISDLRKSLITGLQQNAMFPGWGKIAKQSEKNFIFRNRYNALYRIFDESRSGTNIRYLFMPDDGVFSDQSYFQLVQGNDSTCDFLKYYSPPLPSLRIEGYNVMTDARVTDIDIMYKKGVTRVKIREGEVNYRRHEPSAEVRSLINRKLKKLQYGLYEVKYEVGTVMDSTFSTIEPEQKSTVGGSIAGVTVGIILSAFILLGVSE